MPDRSSRPIRRLPASNSEFTTQIAPSAVAIPIGLPPTSISASIVANVSSSEPVGDRVEVGEGPVGVEPPGPAGSSSEQAAPTTASSSTSTTARITALDSL
jgi:hypothetical protein